MPNMPSKPSLSTDSHSLSSSPTSTLAGQDTDRNKGRPSAKTTRKSHSKSRAGCNNCKTRRIKCDELKPICSNCKRRQVQCSYAGPVTIATLLPKSDPNVMIESHHSLISTTELTLHWATTTCFSMSAWATGARVWQMYTSDIGLKHVYFLHLIFAFTALHLACCRPQRRDYYTMTADHHYELALVLLTPELANITPENCDAVFLSVQLICFIFWARGPQPSEYLAFGEHGRSEWLLMFRGVRTTIESLGPENIPKTHASAMRSKARPLQCLSEPREYEEKLQDLWEYVSFINITDRCNDNIHAVEVLRECFQSRYDGKDSEFHVVFAWLYRMQEGFLMDLQERKPLPLIIYAHFLVLMHEMERFWYMKGWTHHIMGGIHSALEEEYRSWLRWPSEMTCWIPS